MRILALETSAKAVSAAVTEDGKVLCSGYQDTGLTHSRTLMPIVEAMLKNTGLTVQDCDAVAVAAGPGSFTGIRIGVSAAKGLAFADWRVSTALITGFIAKESVISTLGILTGSGADVSTAALGTLFTPVTAAGFLAFTLLYTPCVAAISAVKRELGSGWKAAGVALSQCVIAWMVAFLVYHIAALLLG